MLDDALLAGEAVQRLLQVIGELFPVEMWVILTVQLFQVLYFLDEAVAHVGSEVEVERGNRLSAVHFVLGGFQWDAAQYAGGLNAFRRARLSVSGREAVCKDAIQRVLYASQAFGGVIILIVDVQIVLADGIQHFFAQ